MNSKPKIAILHDAFLYRGGGERLVTLMAKSLDADLIAGFFSEGSFDPRELGFEGNIIPLGKPVFMKGIRHMILKWRFFWNARILRQYDIIIFSGDCLGALRHVSPNAKKIYYCHTPPRYLYDFREQYLARYRVGVRQIMELIFLYFAGVYEKHLKQFQLIFTNSQNVYERLLFFCDIESEILYPPTDTSRFAAVLIDEYTPPFPRKQYFLSFARLSPPKRVDIIVDTFLLTPEQNLILTYGKNDPLKQMILDKIAGAKNIIALESPDDTKLISLIQGAKATVYIPVDEDFGMSPVESMACGTPVIGVADGGLKETILHEKTGILLPISVSTSREDIIQLLQNIIFSLPDEYWKAMKPDCIIQAMQFSLDAFQKKLQSYLKS